MRPVVAQAINRVGVLGTKTERFVVAIMDMPRMVPTTAPLIPNIVDAQTDIAQWAALVQIATFAVTNTVTGSVMAALKKAIIRPVVVRMSKAREH